MKVFLKQLLLLGIVVSAFFFFKVDNALADLACGSSAYCTGTNSYLKVLDCVVINNSYCGNGATQPFAPHTCPTGGGSGSCVAWAAGKNGCGGTPTGGTTTCSCSAAGAPDGFCTASNIGAGCGSSDPYSGTCGCTTAGGSCGSPAGGELGCCLSGSVCGNGYCEGGETCTNCPSDCGTCVSCSCTGWVDGACGGTCGSGSRQQTRTCSPGTCGETTRCVTDASCNPPSGGSECGNGSCQTNIGESCNTCAADCGTCPPTCSCGAWTNGTCNAGGCTGQRQQTRTCTPNACDVQSRCVNDAACEAVPSVDLRVNGGNGPISVSLGGSATLTWTSSNATSCNASGSWTGSKPTSNAGGESTGTLSSPGQRTYTLTCTNGTTNSSDSVVINVASASEPSCALSFSPSSITAAAGSSQGVTVSAVANNGTIDRIDFSSSATSVATVNPASDASSPYQATVNVVAQGVASITARGYMGGALTCSASLPVNGTCTPTCSGNLCGQADGCGGTCPNTDNLTPPPPTQQSPADGADVTATNITIGGVPYKRITLTIRAQTDSTYDASRIYLELYPVGTSCANSLARCGIIANGVTTGQTVTYNFDIPLTSYESVYHYQWRVRHQNATCSQVYSIYSAWRTFIVVDQVTGTILRDDGYVGMSGGVCTSIFAPYPYAPDGRNERIIVTHYSGETRTVSMAANGTYTVNSPVGTSTVEFTTDAATNTCACPGGTCRYTGLSVPETNVNFYYQPPDVRDAWWQTIGGQIYSQEDTTSAVQTLVPDTCFGTCEPYISLRDTLGTVNSSGGVYTGGGGIDGSNASGAQSNNIDEDGRNINVRGAALNGVLENYAYFYRLYSMGVNPANDFSGGSLPAGAPANGRAYYSSGSLTLTSPVNYNSATPAVIFVNGNLNINTTIRVQQGSFVAFIVSGNINIDENVCQNDHESSTPVVEGVYVADGMINVESRGSGDCRFVGAGIFAGWSGIDLNRDFRDGGGQQTWNARNASELFIYRPDFVVNTPERMKRALLEWQEVSP